MDATTVPDAGPRRLRDAQAVIVAPHCDDMAFSLGISLVACSLGRRPLVLNVFSVSNWTAAGRGTGDVQETTRRRNEEERAACRRVGADVEFLAFREPLIRGGYGPGDFMDPARDPEADPVFEEVRRAILALRVELADRVWLFPLGVGHHVDHRILARVGARACRTGVLPRAGFYQDLPYACTHDSAPILKDIEARAGRDLVPIRLAAAPAADKLNLLRIHSSQMTEDVLEKMARWHAEHPEETIRVSPEAAALFEAVS